MFRLVEHFTDEYTVDSDASLSSEVHDAGVGIAALEKEVLIVEVYELVLDHLESLFDALKNKVVPVG